MPFNNPEDNQDETAVPPRLQKLNSPFAGFGVQPLPYPRLGLNGIPSTDKPMGPNQAANTVTRQPDTTPKLSLAQRIAALGQYPFNGSFSNQNAEGAPKIGIGHRILANASATIPPAKLSQPVRGTPSMAGLNNGQRYGEFFSGFVPAGVSPDNSALTKNQTRRGYPEDLGRAAETAISAGAGGALALAAQKIQPASLRKPAVVDASNLVRARSRIHQPQPVPDVKPNLAVTSKNGQKQFKNRLSGLMQGIRAPLLSQQRSSAERAHLTPAEREATAGVAYSETTGGSVAEHEAIISVILNRTASRQRQYVNPGQPATVQNVIHGRIRLRGGRLGHYQFKGVGGTNESHFAGKHDQGAQNARVAAAQIAQNGPSNRATAFIVTQGGEPRTADVAALGNVHFVERVGNVFLYEPGPAAPATNYKTKSLRPQHPQSHAEGPRTRP